VFCDLILFVTLKFSPGDAFPVKLTFFWCQTPPLFPSSSAPEHLLPAEVWRFKFFEGPCPQILSPPHPNSFLLYANYPPRSQLRSSKAPFFPWQVLCFFCDPYLFIMSSLFLPPPLLMVFSFPDDESASVSNVGFSSGTLRPKTSPALQKFLPFGATEHVPILAAKRPCRSPHLRFFF